MGKKDTSQRQTVGKKTWGKKEQGRRRGEYNNNDDAYAPSLLL